MANSLPRGILAGPSEHKHGKRVSFAKTRKVLKFEKEESESEEEESEAGDKQSELEQEQSGFEGEWVHPPPAANTSGISHHDLLYSEERFGEPLVENDYNTPPNDTYYSTPLIQTSYTTPQLPAIGPPTDGTVDNSTRRKLILHGPNPRPVTRMSAVKAASDARAVRQGLNNVQIVDDDDDDSPLGDLEQLGKQVDERRKVSNASAGADFEIIDRGDVVSPSTCSSSLNLLLSLITAFRTKKRKMSKSTRARSTTMSQRIQRMKQTLTMTMMPRRSSPSVPLPMR